MNWAARLARVECPAFPARQSARGAPQSIVLARGDGHEIWDVEGRRYVDLTAGFGSLLLGHGHPAWNAAVAAQSVRLVQGLGDLYANDVKIALMEELAALHPSPGARVLLTQSGSDAVTAAIKTAMLATGRAGVIAFDGAYHGLGYAPLAACGFARAFAAPFHEQLNPHVRFAPYPGLRGATMNAALSLTRQHLKHGDVGLVLVEPVLGRGGIVPPPAGFLKALCELAHEHGALVAADEIWTGLGRAGAWRSGEDVDIICFGKGLGGGLPISACVATDAAMAGWARGVVHTSTHAGAPLACAAALATLRVLRDEDLIERARLLGERALHAYREALAGRVRAVRGVGLMIGIELDSGEAAQAAIGAALERGYLVIAGGVDGATLTLTPPLTIDEAALVAFGSALRAILDA